MSATRGEGDLRKRDYRLDATNQIPNDAQLCQEDAKLPPIRANHSNGFGIISKRTGLC
jgi:hypothetical protein